LSGSALDAEAMRKFLVERGANPLLVSAFPAPHWPDHAAIAPAA
jgi:hypothetical protein